MQNKYPGTCGCGARVEAGKGDARKNVTGKWEVLCIECVAQTASVGEAPGGSPRWASDNGLPVSQNAEGFHNYTLISGHPASDHQAAIFDYFKYGRGSRLVKAVAGSGKTTTVKNAVRHLDEKLSVQLFAFNTEAAGQLKAAVEELRALDGRPYARVMAGTFHSVGFRAVARFLEGRGVKVGEADSAKCRKLFQARVPKAVYTLYGSFVAQLVSLAKGEGIGALVADTEDRWYDLIDHHGLYLDAEEIEDEETGEAFTGDLAAAVDYARRVLAWSNEAAKAGSIDFDDQLYLVVFWKLRLWQNHLVVCDEAQDTNPVRRAILRLALLPGGRLVAVGDPKQSIYGFTGASTDAMDLIAREFNATELPLTVSYRCAAAVVERAQTWVPYIEAASNAAPGAVLDDVPLYEALAALPLYEALAALGPRDAILCRQTAPLVALAYGLIARGRAARIMGREIGTGLINLVEAQKAKGIDRLVEKLNAWKLKEMARFIAKGDERRAEGVADRVGCLTAIIDVLPPEARTVPGLIKRIEAVFSDEDTGVLTLATVHKAKGQEWDKVAVLRPELMPSRGARQEWQFEQELNLMYVAATRAKQTLIYVAEGDEAVEKKGA